MQYCYWNSLFFDKCITLPAFGKAGFWINLRKSERMKETGKAVAKESGSQPQKEEEPKFKVFTERKYSLKD
ncbi:hypothetical protein Taro_018480 [Colocasia esculenta]|uniref:Uncharacterized protein n=1 Tax=Colocasia esculenta TaxID=4460 RepID=A0A843UWC2_COLES|nr:hypothetical protein [Colocasia esculenta]